MDVIHLTPIEYIQIGNTAKHTLGIIPSSSGRPDKVIVGDNDGVLTCFGIKKQHPVVLFKTLGGTAITRLEMLGDRAFVAAGSEVRGYSKKGKNFFTMTTYMTEAINAMCLRDGHIQVAGEYLYTHFVNNKDEHSYMASDTIRDMVAIHLPSQHGAPTASTKHKLPVLACSDRSLRVLEGSRVVVYADLPDVPECLCCFDDPSSSVKGTVLVGAANGTFAMIELGRDGFEVVWVHRGLDQAASVTAIATYDVMGSGTPNVLVGRSDGAVEVYTFEEDGEVDTAGPPTLVHKTSVGSTITSIAGARVSSRDHAEVVVVTYSGHVVGLSSDPALASAESRHAAHASDVDKMNTLNREIAALEEQLASATDAATQQSSSSSSSKEALPSAMPDIDILCNFELRSQLASYLLSIETSVSIDFVLLQSNVPLDLLDVSHSKAVASFTSGGSDGSAVLATYRCEDGITKLDVRLRSIEGQHGTLNVFVVPRTKPKIAHRRELPIRALALHERSLKPIDDANLVNKLEINGSFALADVHSWLAQCLPEVPSRLPTSPSVSYAFRSTFIGTALTCTLATICPLSPKSRTSFSTAQLHATITLTEDVDPHSCVYVLERLAPKLEHQIDLMRKVEIIQTLKELETQEGGRESLSAEYRAILEHAAELMAEYESQPCQLERLYGVVTDLFIDKCKALGLNGKPHLVTLTAILDNYDFNSLIDFFEHEIE
ncbi:hypothetical protein PTSG_09820 [Salpingoeca rosetta]|uniref:Bardet-Biedl syndrome 7 protein n=1 Tax=Salpingoeca rosetta (strain ATCC 50818 / BSB-021) TaxID=946362 RepID=F2UP53_SALR5|nr:uncharacterized protein PTSG_09820 [Salpingoeca rosetta]EGD79408.1 hypothetical protein PTSG_09820 [Salpingoeca rosetta]|eukprot:XP_004989177.1 hypothetical protein PTSG_09820 [Salpingoeca rosetta]